MNRSIPLVDLARQYLNIKGEIQQSINRVCETGVFALGQEVDIFEKEFAQYCGVKYAAGVSSGFDAIFLILKALGIGKGDEVITVSNTFISTVLPIIYTGATPVFVDIDSVTKSIDVAKIKKAMTSRTRAIMPVHLFGYPVDMDDIRSTIGKKKIYLIEDAAQAQGSLYKGRKCGSLGDVSAFSFYPGKNLGAFGEAGMVVSDNKKLIDLIKVYRHVGQKKRYYHDVLGYNNRMDNIQAAVLRIKLRHLDTWNKQRRTHAQLYNSLLKDVVSVPTEDEEHMTNYHIYYIETMKRNKLAEYLSKRGIATGVHYPIPVHLQKAMKYASYKMQPLPVTERKAKLMLSLPMFPELSEEEIRYISKQIHEFFRANQG